MKSKILLSVVLLMFTTFCFAQGETKKMNVEEKVKKTMSELTPQLSLDNDQQVKLQTIFTDYYTEKMKLYEGLQPNAQPDMTQKQKLMSDRDEKLKSALSQQQFQKFKTWEEEMMKQKKDKPAQ